MNDEELEQALIGVSEFHKAQTPTSNTVLAAHMRAIGIHPVGTAWKTAKDALKDGMSFAAAAEVAARAGHRPPIIAVNETEEPDSQRRGIGGASAWRPHGPDGVQTAGSATSGTPTTPAAVAAPAEPAAPTVSPSIDSATGHKVDSPEGGIEPAGTSPQAVPSAVAGSSTDTVQVGLSGAPVMRLRGSSSPALMEVPGGLTTLEWFPKVNGPGDIDGTGAAKLLGTPNVPLSTVLVRETAQNSWDARLGTGQPVVFSLNLRRLNNTETSVLRERVLTGTDSSLGLGEVLSRPETWVLEVSDRGTLGLGGPVRNDIETAMGVPTNYIDLVLNVGAPRDVHLGAGTYGFGKTVSYRVSRAGTVIFWSRSHEEDGIEDRLIGSALGGSFSRHGRRYTGRHWWGVLAGEGQRVEPLVGDAADGLASSIFQSTFEPGQTGTSLMILDPDLGGETREDDSRRLAEAVTWNLWPKLVQDTGGSTPMQIEVLLDGVPVPLPQIESHPALAGFADCLQLVRATQLGYTYTPRFNTEVFEIRSQRPKELLGHLAISRYNYDPRHPAGSEIAPFVNASSHVSLMRHDAELVVKYESGQPLDTEGLQWAAVFKPTADVDDAFAAAEPPAHDDWVPDSIADRATKSRVTIGLRRIRETLRDFLAPRQAEGADAGPKRSTAVLADSLSRLVGGVTGSAPTRQRASGSGGGGGSRRRPQARITRVVRKPLEGDSRILMFRVNVSGAPTPVEVLTHVGVGVEGASYDDEGQVQLLGWTPTEDGGAPSETPLLLSDDQESWLHVRADRDVAVEINLGTQEVE